jgi:hypothetical protein
MRRFKINIFLPLCLMAFILLFGCKKEESYKELPDAVYITSTAVTGTGSNASTTITNSATGKVSVSPATARLYVNTLKDKDVTVSYTLAGTAVAGVNYTTPNPLTIIVPAGKWYADISIPVINVPLVGGNKTIVINLTTATNDIQLGLGSENNYKTFTYTLTN